VLDDKLYLVVLGRPALYRKLQSGGSIKINLTSDGELRVIEITPELMNSFLMEKYGVPLSQFQPDFQKMAQLARSHDLILAPTPAESKMLRIWARMYQTLMPHEISVIQGLVREGFEFPVVIRVFIGCDRNPAATRSTLQNMFAH
jgi:hypothetical protein